MKLINLRGSEVLPVKKEGAIICAWLKSGRESDIWLDGHNEAVSTIEQVSVEVDEEILEDLVGPTAAYILINSKQKWLKL